MNNEVPLSTDRCCLTIAVIETGVYERQLALCIGCVWYIMYSCELIIARLLYKLDRSDGHVVLEFTRELGSSAVYIITPDAQSGSNHF